ncbi:DUF1800 domain-containing protein [Deminuibacter soli]|uniref:DUF1800 domain-containing protein n=1 Tax=Deminuibacter soli TaxID=2291815 RepID=A0A3E1NCX8_9BACT|nr:DUF1800 domain-containing protein [Deminuibacter soli]RFM25846.1 DUF1800 domain-containing protein [Deminuibacter soli]
MVIAEKRMHDPGNNSKPVPAINAGIKRFKGKWTPAMAQHLAKRTLFGASPDDIRFFAGMSLQKSVHQLLNANEAMPEPPLHYLNDERFTDPDVPLGSTWVNQLTYTGMNNSRRENSFRAWWVGLMINQERSLREKMVLFWHNHFVTEMRSLGNALYGYRYNSLLRTHALGNFKVLVAAITRDTAMLRYLNGQSNTKKAPDENYGRELQELFTIGKGPGSHYTEDDVKAAARVLTGYAIDTKTLTSNFIGNRHDDTDKQFSAFYNSTVIKGRKGNDGILELNDMLDMIFAQEEVSRFICRKLYRFFVYHVIDTITEQNVIEPLAKTFRKNDYDIKPVLQQLFESKHFYDAGNRGGMIKSPVDFTLGLCREFKVAFPPPQDYVNQYGLQQQLYQQASNLQQTLGDPPNVAGWPAYYQAPQYDKLWVNSDTLPKRSQFSDRMMLFGFNTKDKTKILVDPVAFAKQTSDPGNPDVLINESVHLLYMVELPQKDKDYIKTNILLSGLQGMASDHYWTQAWQTMLTKPADAANLKNVTGKLKNLYKYLMNLPQYQLM